MTEIEMKNAVQRKEDIFILVAENQAQIKTLSVRLDCLDHFRSSKRLKAMSIFSRIRTDPENL
jgi:hypothetical protein